MRYIQHSAPDDMHIAEADIPEAGPDEVLIKVDAAGVNRPDVMQRRGLYPPPPGASPILGLEVAGTIAALGVGVTNAAIGDRVCALVNGGGYAAYCVAPVGQCLPWPTGYTAIQAAALPETFFTVWANLFGPNIASGGHLKAGQTALIHGGSSGIGTTAIQLAKAFGATVFVTAGSDAKCQACRDLGADAAINYTKEDFAAVVKQRTGGAGVNVVLDMVAGPYLSRNVRALGRDGRLVIIATQGGPKDPDFDILPVMMKRLVITGSTLRPRSAGEKAALASELRSEVWPLLNQGLCAPVMHATFPLEQASAAHALMESSAHIGKIVLTLE